MNSQDGSMRPSEALKMFGGKSEKLKRRRVNKKKREDEQRRHTTTEHRSVIAGIPQHPSVIGLSPEERILLYMKRAEQGKESKKPVNIFTGELYNKEELEVSDDGTGDE